MSMKETYGHMLYPSYKPTGIPWLGDVPDHWATERLKQHVDDVNEQTRERLSQDIYIALENVEGWTGKITAAENEVSFDSQVKKFQVGDVLFGKLRPYLAKVAAPNRKGLCVGEFLVLRSQQDSLSPDYLEQLLRSKGVIDTVDASTFGAKMPRADWNFIGSMLFPIPPMDEQLAIVRYLDDADQRIRAYVSAKERLIALLEEERQAVIHQAVTKGLDPNVRLKSSGVEWLGDVPEHWKVVQLGRIGSFSKGSGGTKDDEVPKGIPCIRYGDLYTTHKFFIDQTRSFIRDEKLEQYTPIKRGDVLFPASGETIEEIGKSAVNLLDAPVYCGSDLIIFRPSVPMDPKFSGYVLDTPISQDQKSRMGRGVSIMHIYSNQLKYLWLGLPPVDEQEAIAEHIDRVTGAIDTAISRAKRQIKLLEEYRTRLIADVVTGKIDVREESEQSLTTAVQYP